MKLDISQRDCEGIAAEEAVVAHRIAIVGSGPRGLSVLERIAARVLENGLQRPLELYLIDPVQVGCGRIWRTDQPDWFVMNTVADEVSAFSGPWTDGPARPGAGPSLAQWWQSRDPAYPGPNSYAPRALHGHYMLYVLETIELSLRPLGVLLHKVSARVEALRPHADGCQLSLSNNVTLDVHRVVLTTGHSQHDLEPLHRSFSELAGTTAGVRYLAGDSAADMPLEEIAPGTPVGILGLGLSFFDVMASLTLGRGGCFVHGGNDGLEYVPSGREPVLYAGSRSGLCIPARGRNQKHPNYRLRPAIFTMNRVLAMRQNSRIDFREQILPLLMAEVNLVYCETTLRRSAGDAAAVSFRQLALQWPTPTTEAIVALARALGCPAIEALDLEQLAYPFSDVKFANPEHFERTLLRHLAEDVAHALQGNVDSPLKAALDVIRDTRGLIRAAVDFGGLTPRSHAEDFLEWYVPRSNMLSAGPPLVRLQQASALMRAGVLRVVGPSVRVLPQSASGRYVMDSPQVDVSGVEVDVLIDARIPIPNVATDRSPLTRQLVSAGIWTAFVNHGTREGDALVTGGVAVTPAPFHPLDHQKRPNRNLYVLGIPTEHTRWFMHAGSSRPGFWTDFVTDADAIAADALRPASPALATHPRDLQARVDETAEALP